MNLHFMKRDRIHSFTNLLLKKHESLKRHGQDEIPKSEKRKLNDDGVQQIPYKLPKLDDECAQPLCESQEGNGDFNGKSQNENDFVADMDRAAGIFSVVPGRMSILSGSKKYKVTIDEIRRRTSPPERLNASVLGAVLRRAKAKNGGQVLREQLDHCGLQIASDRKKSSYVTLLTSLVEGEAEDLAADFSRICRYTFPISQVALKLNQSVLGKNRTEITSRRSQMVTAM